MRSHQNTPHNLHSKCGPKERSKPLLSEQNYSIVEEDILKIARLFFVTFGQPDSQLWMHAYRFADQLYPAMTGTNIAQATLVMLNEMRMIRPHTFNYTDPRCACCSAFVTAEERYLMDSFRHIRQGSRTRAHMAAMLLCEGNDPSAFLDAATRLNEMLCNIPLRAGVQD